MTNDTKMWKIYDKTDNGFVRKFTISSKLSYECTFELDSGKDYTVSVAVQWKRYFDVPNPRYEEWNFEDLGGAITNINL